MEQCKRKGIHMGGKKINHLDHFYVGQTVQKGLQVDAVQHNTVVKNVSVRLEVNHCLLLQVREEK